jgi:hypothetical protein
MAMGDISSRRNSPIECSSVFYETVAAASRAGRQALKEFLTEFPTDECT